MPQHVNDANQSGFRGWLKKYKRIVISLIGVSLIPLLYAGALVWVNHDPLGRLDQVPAAVVNLDSPAKMPDGDTISLGPDIVKEVLDNDNSSNLDWSEKSAKTAAKDLRNGKVEAVMTIPKGFSAAAASAGDDDPMKAHSTHLSIETNDASNYLMGTISKTLGNEVTNTIRGKVTDTYLKNLYVGFTDIHGNIKEAADGSKTLSENTSKAHDSVGDLVVGLDKLADGTVQLDSGAGQLAAASGKLDSGAATLSSGLQTLQGKTADLPATSSKLADGADTLHQGLGQVSTASSKLADGAGQLHDATGTMAEKASALPGATKKLADGAAQVSSGNDQLADKAAAVDQAATDVTKNLDKTLDSLDQLISDSTGISSSTNVDVAGTAKNAKRDADRLLASKRVQDFLNQPGNEDLKQQLNGLKSNTDQVASGAEATRKAIERAERSAGVVQNGRGTSIDKLKEGTAKVRSTTGALKKSTTTLAGGADQVAAGTKRLSQQAPALASGAKQLNGAAGQLADGTGQLKSNLPKLVDGSGQLADGTAQLKKAVPTLTDAVGRLSDGATTLHGGTGELTAATAKLAGASSQLVDGADTASNGSKKLDDGLEQLSDGAKELHGGLNDGVKQIPNYSKDDQDHLAKVNATPVSSKNTQNNSMGNYGTGLSPYFMSLALWIGGIGFFMLMAPLSERLLRSRFPSVVVALRSVWAPAIMALVQAAFVMLVVHFVIGIDMAHPVKVWALAMFTSLTFLIVNQGLIAILGAPGRFGSLILVVLQVASAGGTYPVQTMPDFLQGLRTILPMTYTTQAFRSLIAGDDGLGVGKCVLVLSIWLVIGFGLVILATWLARRSETVRDWATLAPGRPNGGRPADSIAPAVIPGAAPNDSTAGPETELVPVLVGAGEAGNTDPEEGHAHGAHAASWDTPAPNAPVVPEPVSAEPGQAPAEGSGEVHEAEAEDTAATEETAAEPGAGDEAEAEAGDPAEESGVGHEDETNTSVDADEEK